MSLLRWFSDAAAEGAEAAGGDGGGKAAAAASAAAAAGMRRLYVGNISYEARAEDLAKHFSAYGNVADVIIPLDHLGRSRGYGFVEMDGDGATSAAGTLNESQFMGRTIFVNEARPREDRPPRGEGRPRRDGDGGGRGGGRFGGGGGGQRRRERRQEHDDEW